MSSKKKMISVRIDIELAKALDIYIFEKKLKGKNISKSGVVEGIIQKFLNEQKDLNYEKKIGSLKSF
jgi:metal-responsive CopG/Arc/MetJ family transcriptional regulator